jgi:ABC-type bacteriocin/lantibiotic exporter with double-glycine peptidase domain
MNPIKKIIALLTLDEKKKGIFLFFLVLMMALLDAIGVASIVPFIAVLSNPKIIESNVILFKIYQDYNFSSTQEFLFFLGIVVFFLVIFSTALKAFTTYSQLRFSLLCEVSIGKRMVESYLSNPYKWFLTRHSASLGKSILSDVNTVVFNGLFPLLTLVVQGMVAMMLLGLLLTVDRWLALSVGIFLGATYLIIFKLVSNLLHKKGAASVEANNRRYTAISEAFGAIKDVKLRGLEEVYVNLFAKPAEIFAKKQASLQIISQMPRFALEAISIGGILLIIFYLMNQFGKFSEVLPIISLYVFAGYRLMPALQQMYHAYSQIRFNQELINSLYGDLISNKTGEKLLLNDKLIQFNNSITINNIKFTYPNSPKPALRGISLNIPKYNSIAIIGSTGSGKSTLIDLVLGLLDADSGHISVDDQVINDKNKREWQNIIGYVPQQIFLIDSSIADNIAFGVPPSEVDMSRVVEVAKMASLHNFIVGNLPQGYLTAVGERGARLSGGQRQRIGIARALYHDPQILVLDEATSSLDSITELAVMESISALAHKVTMITIAHRLSTVKNCDVIYILEDGAIKDCGSYSDLLLNNKDFQKMINPNL